MTSKITDKIYDFCHREVTIIGQLAIDPLLAPSEAGDREFGSHGLSVIDQKPPKDRVETTEEDLKRAFECGKWGNTQPSDQFLRIYHDALCCLDQDPMAGMVSPCLMGSSGVIPFSVISALPDICRHMSNLIVRAKHEIVLATNFWKESRASQLITDALRELSKRAGQRGQNVVVKILFDRGSVKQVIHNHLELTSAEWSTPGIALPSKDAVPFLDMQVVNFHRPVLGTFHCKYMIVDRNVAIVQSNNIQDNDNLEMMTQLEGPIVDSLYDMALLSWHEQLKPELPLLQGAPPRDQVLTTFQTQSFLDLAKDFPVTITQLAQEMNNRGERLPSHNPGNPHWDDDLAGEMLRMQSVLTPSKNEQLMDLVAAHLNSATGQDLKVTAADCDPEDNMTPFIPHAVHEEFPIALVCRKPWGAVNHTSHFTPQNEAWLSAIRNAKHSIFIQSPNVNAAPLYPELVQAIKRGVMVTIYACLGYNDLGELLPYQGGTNDMFSHKLYGQLTPDEYKLLDIHWYVGKDQTKPLHNKFKKRSCHIKIMIVDEHIGIQGSGNQDTQSWYHSQEVNVLIDSELVCKDWLKALRRNQNTHLYGKVDPSDGLWRDEQGNTAEGSLGFSPGHMSVFKGAWGILQRTKGTKNG